MNTKIFQYVLCILVSTHIFCEIALCNNADAYINRAKYLFQNNLKVAATKVLRSGYETTQSNAILDYWLDMNSEWIATFPDFKNEFKVWEL